MQEVGEAPPAVVELSSGGPRTKLNDVVREYAKIVVRTRDDFIGLKRQAEALDDGKEDTLLQLGFLLLPGHSIYPENERDETYEDVIVAAQIQQRFVHALGYLNATVESSSNEELAELLYETIKMHQHIIHEASNARVALPRYWHGMKAHAALASFFPEVYLPNKKEVERVDVSRGIDGIAVWPRGRDRYIFLFDAKHVARAGSLEIAERGGGDNVSVGGLPGVVQDRLRSLSYTRPVIKRFVFYIPGATLVDLPREVSFGRKSHPYMWAVNQFAKLDKGAQKGLDEKQNFVIERISMLNL